MTSGRDVGVVQVRRLDEAPTIDLGPRCLARLLVWPGMGARSRALHHLRIEQGATTHFLAHHSEAVYYVAAGAGLMVAPDCGQVLSVRIGQMVLLDPETRYRVTNNGDEPLVLLGGPCPPDEGDYR